MVVRDLDEEKEVQELMENMTPELLESKALWYQYQTLLYMRDLMESIPSFARDSDESSWRILTDPSNSLYSESDLVDMRDKGEELYYVDPSARGLVEAMVNFVIGKDVTIVPEDEDETVRDYWQHFWEINGMDLRVKEILRRALKSGDMFLRFFPINPELDYVNDIPVRYNIPVVRFIRPNEIKDIDNIVPFGIRTDPDDVETVIEYIRAKPTGFGYEIREVIPADQIIHFKYNADSDMLRGISFFVGIAKYIRKYAQWLDDRCVLNKIRTIFNLIMKVNGKPSTFTDKFEAATSPASVSSTAANTSQKKMPNRGSVLVSSPGVEYEFANLNIKAQDTKDDGRAIELMLSKGTGFTEYITRGDASNANYASSMVSESPMVRTFEACQDLLAYPLTNLYRKVIRYGVERGQIPRTTERTVVTVDPVSGKETIKKEKGDINRNCTINYEALIHRDVKAEAEAFQIHKQEGWDSDRGITTKLGNDYESVQTEVRREEVQNLERQKRRMQLEAEAENELNSNMRGNKNPDNTDDNNNNDNGEE